MTMLATSAGPFAALGSKEDRYGDRDERIPFVAVDDVDGATERAVGLGGKARPREQPRPGRRVYGHPRSRQCSARALEEGVIMTVLNNELLIDAPRGKVWAMLSNLEALERYDPVVLEARRVSDAGVGAERHRSTANGGWFREGFLFGSRRASSSSRSTRATSR
jgi:hypothetical protein